MRRTLLSLAILATVSTTSGCFLVAAGVGAGGAIAYTNRGASAKVPATVDVAFDHAVATFSAMSISETGRTTENSGATRRLIGKLSDQEITVEITRSSDDVSNVEVIAKRNVVDYDKDRAKEVLDKIVAQK